MKKGSGKNVEQNESKFLTSNSPKQNCESSSSADMAIINTDKKFIHSDSTFKVRVNVPILNVRKGPSNNYEITTQIKDRGIYTIMAEQDGWGRLKSGAGWIFLDYTNKL